MTDLREYGKQIRRFLKLVRELQDLNIVEDFENKTLTEIRVTNGAKVGLPHRW
ncbi:hypothetical protein M5796_004684 [Salmonella enterica]|nr:hypothetical protein [Salmonella enterica subsp. enterica serovar Sandiego]EJE9657762.1 hypothetical protein [Salmonella enterica]EJE9776666.1 hypothetical protein [Salmonella enterica]EJF5536491.1 hypothetical protein [Salmonella enterica]EJX5314609.1 hypothetical protein [Salmonella enterica]